MVRAPPPEERGKWEQAVAEGGLWHHALLLIDAVEGLHNQDLKIATLAWESGRGLIMVVNKWDLMEKDDKSAAHFQKECVEKAPYLRYVPFVFTSALTGQRAVSPIQPPAPG